MEGRSRFVAVSVAIALCLTLPIAALSADEGEAVKKNGAAACAFSILLGYGSGQIYLGTGGWGYFAMQTGTTVGMVGGLGYYYYNVVQLALSSSADDINWFSRQSVIGMAVGGVSALAHLVVAVVQVVDVFMDVDRLRAEGGIVAVPYLDLQPTSASAGVRLRL